MNISKQQINNIKMIVCDLDGTLFDFHKNISADTIKYLINLQRQGYILVIATGRFFYELDEYITSLEMEKYHGYVICCNGTEIHDLANKHVHNFETLNQNDINNLLVLSNKHKINVRTNFENKYQMILNPWSYRLIPIIRLFTKRYPDLKFYHRHEQTNWNNIGKFCAISTPDKLKSFHKQALTTYLDMYSYYYTSPFCIEIVKKDINKCHAVDYICKLNNLSLKNVLAFGDSGNDEMLLSNAGIGVIMKNAQKHLKNKIPNISVTSNNHEGVLKTLNIILKK